MTDDPISRIEAALAHLALYDEGASLEDTWEAVCALRRACNPAAIRALLDRLKAAEQRAEYWKAEHLAGNAKIERLRKALEQARPALEHAATICDGVPTRDPGYLGQLVNVQLNGFHGYRLIHDARDVVRAALTGDYDAR